jgi:hypothetical protein
MLRKLTILAVLAVMAVACEPDPGTLALPYRRDVPVLIGTHVNSYASQEVKFTLDMAVYKGDNSVNVVPYFEGLPDSSWQFTDFWYVENNDSTFIHHQIEKSEFVDTSAFSTFSTLMLIDQSGFPENFDTTDYYNERFEAYNAFYKNLNGQGKVAFAWFRRAATEHDVVKYINSEFSENWEPGTMRELLDLTHEQGGTAALYDAIERAIYFIAAKNLDNPSVTVLIKNRDDGKSDITLDNLIALAKQNNVRINIIWLIHRYQNVDFSAMRKLPYSTGGFEVYMSSSYQMNTVFLRLPDLLRVTTSFYRVKVKMTATGPEPFANIYSTGVYLYYYTSQFYNWSYIPIILVKP